MSVFYGAFSTEIFHLLGYTGISGLSVSIRIRQLFYDSQDQSDNPWQIKTVSLSLNNIPGPKIDG